MSEVLKLDLGCGKNKAAGFLGVDSIQFEGVDVVHDLADRSQPWPWADSSVDEVNCSHFIEHLTNFNEKWERVWFFNELYRVLKPGAKCTLIFPHWCSNRYYGDPTHKEPFSEMGFFYLSKEWRLDQGNAPHTDISKNQNGYSCDLQCGWAYSFGPALQNRTDEYRMYALQNYKEAAMDIIATLTAIKK